MPSIYIRIEVYRSVELFVERICTTRATGSLFRLNLHYWRRIVECCNLMLGACTELLLQLLPAWAVHTNSLLRNAVHQVPDFVTDLLIFCTTIPLSPPLVRCIVTGGIVVETRQATGSSGACGLLLFVKTKGWIGRAWVRSGSTQMASSGTSLADCKRHGTFRDVQETETRYDRNDRKRRK